MTLFSVVKRTLKVYGKKSPVSVFNNRQGSGYYVVNTLEYFKLNEQEIG